MAEYENIIDLDKLGRFHNNLKDKGLPLNDWQANKEYKVGYTVIQDGKLYRCKTEHTSTTTFDDTKWSVVSSSGIPYYTSNISYKVDDQVVYDNKIYKCVTAHTSTTIFDDTKWEEIGGRVIGIWQANTDYEVNDIVIDSNLIWQCATAHTSTNTFDEGKWICLSGGEISNGMEIVPLWEGEFSFNNSTEGATPTSSTPMIELVETMQNFEYLYIETVLLSNTVSQQTHGDVCSIDKINGSTRVGIVVSSMYYSTVALKDYDGTHLYAAYTDTAGWPAGSVTAIKGIRKAKPIVSSGMKYETLWEGEAGNLSSSGNTTISLLESYNIYQKLGVTVVFRENSYDFIRYYEVTKEMLTASESNMLPFGYSSSNSYIGVFKATSSNVISIDYVNAKVTKVIGISEGVQIPTGVQAARVTLWEGKYGVSNQSSTLTQTQEILSILGYDQFEVTVADDGVSNMTTNIFNVSDMYKDLHISFQETSGYYANFIIKFKDDTHFGISYKYSAGFSSPCVTKIVGIKYIQPDSYSTEEKLIGTWIDGKSLYRKVFTNVSDGYSTGLTYSNYTIIKYYGMISSSGYSIIIPQPYEDSYRITLFINPDGTISLFNNTMGTPPPMSYMAVEYTKN